MFLLYYINCSLWKLFLLYIEAPEKLLKKLLTRVLAYDILTKLSRKTLSFSGQKKVLKKLLTLGYDYGILSKLPLSNNKMNFDK